MKEFIIKPHEAGQKLDKYLTRILPEAPKSVLYKNLRKKNIVLNDKRADGHEILSANDNVKIYFSDETFEKFAKKSEVQIDDIYKTSDQRKVSQKLLPSVIYEDQDILLLNKPAGLLSQKAKSTDYSANDFVLEYLVSSGQLSKEDLLTFKPSICNRLDRNTSGILIAGKTMTGLQQMAKALKSRDLAKYYLCLVEGKLPEARHLKGYLAKDEASNKVTVKECPFEGADPIETSYEPVEYHGNSTLLLVHLITGRSHQIRAHLASMGHPILGDYKYGRKKVNDDLKKNTGIGSQLLHAYRLILPDGRKYEAELPAQFHTAMKFLDRSSDSIRQIMND